MGGGDGDDSCGVARGNSVDDGCGDGDEDDDRCDVDDSCGVYIVVDSCGNNNDDSYGNNDRCDDYNIAACWWV